MSSSASTVTLKSSLARIVLIFVLPIVATIIYPPVMTLRHFYLISVIIYIVISSLSQIKSNFTKSLSRKSLNDSFTPLFLPTIVFMVLTPIAVLFFPHLFYRPFMLFLGMPVPFLATIVGYFFVSVPLQEIIFRFFLQYHLEKIISKQIILHLLNGFIFGLAHLSLGSNAITLGTMILGYVWSQNYHKYQNIITVALSHSLAGSYLIICLYYFLP